MLIRVEGHSQKVAAEQKVWRHNRKYPRNFLEKQVNNRIQADWAMQADSDVFVLRVPLFVKRARQRYRSFMSSFQNPESLMISWVVCLTILTIFEGDHVSCELHLCSTGIIRTVDKDTSVYFVESLIPEYRNTDLLIPMQCMEDCMAITSTGGLIGRPLISCSKTPQTRSMTTTGLFIRTSWACPPRAMPITTLSFPETRLGTGRLTSRQDRCSQRALWVQLLQDKGRQIIFLETFRDDWEKDR